MLTKMIHRLYLEVMHDRQQQCGKYLVYLHENNLLFWVSNKRGGVLPSAKLL